MRDVNRLTVDEFFAWQALVDGRYELRDGHIVPHPDYFDVRGLAAPDNGHGRIVANLAIALGAQLRHPCRVYAGSGAVVDRTNANVPDLAVSCAASDEHGVALRSPRFVFEVSSPKTARIDTGRKVEAYGGIVGLEAYVFVDRRLRSITVYRPDATPHTQRDGRIDLAADVALDVDAVFA